MEGELDRLVRELVKCYMLQTVQISVLEESLIQVSEGRFDPAAYRQQCIELRRRLQIRMDGLDLATHGDLLEEVELPPLSEAAPSHPQPDPSKRPALAVMPKKEPRE